LTEGVFDAKNVSQSREVAKFSQRKIFVMFFEVQFKDREYLKKRNKNSRQNFRPQAPAGPLYCPPSRTHGIT
jgi:hypothetical protein